MTALCHTRATLPLVSPPQRGGPGTLRDARDCPGSPFLLLRREISWIPLPSPSPGTHPGSPFPLLVRDTSGFPFPLHPREALDPPHVPLHLQDALFSLGPFLPSPPPSDPWGFAHCSLTSTSSSWDKCDSQAECGHNSIFFQNAQLMGKDQNYFWSLKSESGLGWKGS